MPKERLLSLAEVRARHPASRSLQQLADLAMAVSKYPGVLGIWIVDQEQTAGEQPDVHDRDMRAYIACKPTASIEHGTLIAHYGEQVALRLGWRLLAVIATNACWELVWQAGENGPSSPS